MAKNHVFVLTYLFLKLRQYKNGFVSVKGMLVFKLARYFPCRVGEGKRAANSKQTCFSQKRVRSYIVLALVVMNNIVRKSD